MLPVFPWILLKLVCSYVSQNEWTTGSFHSEMAQRGVVLGRCWMASEKSSNQISIDFSQEISLLMLRFLLYPEDRKRL